LHAEGSVGDSIQVTVTIAQQKGTHYEPTRSPWDSLDVAITEIGSDSIDDTPSEASEEQEANSSAYA
jgi:hypothetical protein